MADLLIAALRANLAASVAAIVVLAMRAPLRRWFGADRAYAAWLVVPLAAVGCLMPPPLVAGPASAAEATGDQLLAWLRNTDHEQALARLWLVGALVAAVADAVRHHRFSTTVRAGRAGPAVVGILAPRIVMPADVADRFTVDERRLVRAHERTHIERNDPRWSAAAALAIWVFWFNPLLRLAFRAMRLDQELACDAAVLAQFPNARRLYADTLLRTHQTPGSPGLGCAWGSAQSHPLEIRIGMLALARPSQVRRDLGVTLLISLAVAAFGAAWVMQPPARGRAPAAEPPTVLVEFSSPSDADARLGASVYRSLAARRER